MDREPSETEVVAALRSELSGWRPRRVPDLIELTRPSPDSWQRPVAFASAFGAAGLAVVLILAVLLVVVTPANVDVGWAGTVRDHLTHMP